MPSNIVLDELDKELEKRALRFVWHGDDCVIFVKSRLAANRVMSNISRFIENKLRLKVNRQKSSIILPWKSKYLGFCVTNSNSNPKIRIRWKSIKRFMNRAGEITSSLRGCSMRQVFYELNEYMRGWWSYFGLTEPYSRDGES